jgi:hypothetical protein
MAATSLVRTMRRNSFEELVFQIRPKCEQDINSKPFDLRKNGSSDPLRVRNYAEARF